MFARQGEGPRERVADPSIHPDWTGWHVLRRPRTALPRSRRRPSVRPRESAPRIRRRPALESRRIQGSLANPNKGNRHVPYPRESRSGHRGRSPWLSECTRHRESSRHHFPAVRSERGADEVRTNIRRKVGKRGRTRDDVEHTIAVTAVVVESHFTLNATT